MSIGSVLRAAREARGLGVTEAAAATRMKAEHIEALESDNFARFAAPIYAQGFIRLYAEYLGLDPTPLLQEYVEHHAGRARPSGAVAAIMARKAAEAAELEKGADTRETVAEAAGRGGDELPAVEPVGEAAGAGTEDFATGTRRGMAWIAAALAAVLPVASMLVWAVRTRRPSDPAASSAAQPAPPTSGASALEDPPVIESPPAPLFPEIFVPPIPSERKTGQPP